LEALERRLSRNEEELGLIKEEAPEDNAEASEEGREEPSETPH